MREMAMEPAHTILFLCPHNAAKSVIAAAYFDRLARERGLDYRAASAGTSPDAAPSPAVVAMLRDEGIDVAGYRPRHVTTEDLTSAHRVISLGCDPGDLDGDVRKCGARRVLHHASNRLCERQAGSARSTCDEKRDRPPGTHDQLECIGHRRPDGRGEV